MNNSIKLKRILALLLALVMSFSVFLITSCSDNSSYSEDDDDDDDDDDEKDDYSEDDNGGKDGSTGRNDFIDQIGGVSETYTGAVSTESYSSATEAAEAYVDVEISGQNEVNIISSKSNGTLSNSEVSKLNIPKDALDEIESVEEIEVKYSLTESVSGVNSEKLNTSKTVTVYIIKYPNVWKYYSPIPKTGDTITKSYYDSVFNSDVYENCTLHSIITISAVIDGYEAGQSITYNISMTMDQLVKHDDGKIYLEQITTSSMNGQESSSYIYAYIEEDEYGYVSCYVKTDPNSDEWYPGNLYSIGFTSIEELTPFYDQYLDYTYFTKTKYGFSLDKQYASRYLEEAINGLDAFGSIADDTDLDVSMFAEYYINDGTLSGARVDADVSMDVSQSGAHVTMNESVKVNTTCTNYGTTVVEKPFD